MHTVMLQKIHSFQLSNLPVLYPLVQILNIDVFQQKKQKNWNNVMLSKWDDRWSNHQYLCINIYMHMHTLIVCVCACVCVCVCMHASVRVHVRAYLWASLSICVYMCVGVCVCVCDYIIQFCVLVFMLGICDRWWQCLWGEWGGDRTRMNEGLSGLTIDLLRCISLFLSVALSLCRFVSLFLFLSLSLSPGKESILVVPPIV